MPLTVLWNRKMSALKRFLNRKRQRTIDRGWLTVLPWASASIMHKLSRGAGVTHALCLLLVPETQILAAESPPLFRKPVPTPIVVTSGEDREWGQNYPL